MPEPETPSLEEVAAQEDATRSEQRTENLLRRDRSIFGTVRTGLRGLLSSSTRSTSGAERKTLLGE